MPHIAVSANNDDTDRIRMLTHTAYDADTVRSLERPLLDRNVPLMRMAARAVADTAVQMLDDEDLDISDARVVLLAGAGDNGGDGLYAAARLASNGAMVTAIAVGRSLHEAALTAFARAGGKVLVLDPQASIPGCSSGFSAGEAGERFQRAIRVIERAHVVIDAMTGIGVSGALRGISASIASSVGVDGLPPDRPALLDYASEQRFPLVLAVDTPSGVGVDDGSLPGAYIPADVTVTFGALKPCAMLPPACYAMGRLILVDFGFDSSNADTAIEMADDDFAGEAVRLPHLYDSKYSRSVVGLITGSARYPGAAVLSVKGASRANVGMVRYLGPQRAQDMVLAARPEVVLGKGHVQAWVVGSGVPSQAETDDTTDDVQRTTIARLLQHYDTESDSNGSSEDSNDAYDMPPIVVDAGALDLLPAHVPSHVLITPHAAELARLLTRLGDDTDTEDVMAEPWHYARRAHELTGATVLLKGAVTVVVGEDGNGEERTVLAGAAPAWLSTAGSGDVLAGMLGALLAQNTDDSAADLPSVVDIAAAGAHVHGLAAAIASESDQHGWQAPMLYGRQDSPQLPSFGHPIIASDMVAAIPQAFEDVVQ